MMTFSKQNNENVTKCFRYRPLRTHIGLLILFKKYDTKVQIHHKQVQVQVKLKYREKNASKIWDKRTRQRQ